MLETAAFVNGCTIDPILALFHSTTAEARMIRAALSLVVVLSGQIPAAAQASLSPETDAVRLAGIFHATGWVAGPSGFGGIAKGEWTCALAGNVEWTNYAAEFDITLTQPADRRDGLELGAYTEFRSLANLGGYEAAVVVRHESEARHYRIAISTLWDEVIVWRPSGGVVQVKTHPFEIGKTYRLRVECRGPQFTVRIDGQQILEWWDRADPVLQGKVGIGRKEGETYVRRAAIEPLAAAPADVPVHVPHFREREWHGERYFFDGDEPLFVLTRGNILDHLKFLPGYRPSLYAFNYVTDWAQFTPNKVIDSKVLESGQRLILETTAIDPSKKDDVISRARLTVTYEPEVGMYLYDHSCTTTIVSPGVAAKVGSPWDHGDAVFLGCVGSARTRDPKAYRSLYGWTLFQAPDGKPYRVPLNPNGHFLAKSSNSGGPLRPDGGYVLAIGDAVLSPVIRIPELPDSFTTLHTGLCWWAFDVHTLFTPKLVNGQVPAGSYTSRVQYTGMPAAEAKVLFEKAEFYEPLDLNVEIPVFAAGMGRVESFDRMVRLASPHPEHRIWAGVLDRMIGCNDHSSLGLDGPTDAWTLTGPSYFTGNYAPQNLVTAWVRTKDVQGEGPTFGLRRLDTNTVEFHRTGLTGTNDWTEVQYVTSFPGDSFGVHVLFRNSGSGTVWIDDFRIEPFDENIPIAVTAAPQVFPAKPTDSETVLQWSGRGDATSVLDESGNGHHGKLYGAAMWTESEDRRALVFDGKSTYAWPLHSPDLTLGPPCTIEFELKPEAPGMLAFWGFQFAYQMGGGPELFTVEYQPNGGKVISSKPFLRANEWQKLALVVTEKNTAIYHDGNLVEELATQPIAGNWALHLQSTWHRHLSLFGVGPGDMALIPEPSGHHWKGQVRSVRVVRRALSAVEQSQK